MKNRLDTCELNCFEVSEACVCVHVLFRQPATAKWYDRRDAVFIEFCVEDSKDVHVRFDKTKLDFR